MTARVAPLNSAFAEPPTIISPTAEHDVMRGRKRERSMTRGNVRSIRCAPSDESSTLRGRSRRRAVSPSLGYTSRASSPRRVLSPTRRRLLHARLRREHCPSRVASPVEQQRPFRRRQRTRSRSRGPRLEMELEAARQADILSGLRNEVRASSSDDEKDRAKTGA
ncbi:branched-chain amino acid aminotransferase [Fusarium albosuccineum]|uniref:Branched-chain amino acid aminotransferase n=1 Tax=Fusarium albosuccineum TaxID=1237068 RepID=A0A8H4PG66_9HYPO|nr:branched-chain amino acid aminotransferase [Fusarium albosuccineum]